MNAFLPESEIATAISGARIDIVFYVSICLPLVVTYHHAQHAQMSARGDPTRRAILERLLKGPLPVGELARQFPVSRPAISQHLRVLKKAHLVVDTPVGNRRLGWRANEFAPLKHKRASAGEPNEFGWQASLLSD